MTTERALRNLKSGFGFELDINRNDGFWRFLGPIFMQLYGVRSKSGKKPAEMKKKKPYQKNPPICNKKIPMNASSSKFDSGLCNATPTFTEPIK